MYDDAPPGCADWALPLMQHFAELLHAQLFVQEALGPVCGDDSGGGRTDS